MREVLLDDPIAGGKHMAAGVVAKAQSVLTGPNYCGRCSMSATSRRTRRRVE